MNSGEGLGRVWEDVFLETDKGLKTEDGCTATAVLVWKEASGNICIQVSYWNAPPNFLVNRTQFYSCLRTRHVRD